VISGSPLNAEYAQLKNLSKPATQAIEAVSVEYRAASPEKQQSQEFQAELDKKSAENLKLENLIKEQRIYISSNYEAYLGKEYVTVEKLTELKQVMISGGAATVAQALAVYREKHL
jgi:hypothetical protein